MGLWKDKFCFSTAGKNYKIKNSGIARAPPRKESKIFVTLEMILANFLIIKHTEVSSTILVKVNYFAPVDKKRSSGECI